MLFILHKNYDLVSFYYIPVSRRLLPNTRYLRIHCDIMYIDDFLKCSLAPSVIYTYSLRMPPSKIIETYTQPQNAFYLREDYVVTTFIAKFYFCAIVYKNDKNMVRIYLFAI